MFFLNRGIDEYLVMSDTEKANQLNEYNITSFFDIWATNETRRKLEGHRLVFRNLGAEIVVWSKVTESDDTEPFIDLADDLSLTFLLKKKDTYFYNYTLLKLENAGKLYYFSNKRESTEPVAFPLINQSGDNSIINENFILSPAGITNELENLTALEKDNLYGIIKIHMKGENASLNVTDAQGKLLSPYKTFEILFENRKTAWRYFFDTGQTTTGADDVKIEDGDSKVLITKTDQPLTQKGFVSIKLSGVELPNPNSELIKPDSTSSKIYSEIYI